VDSYLKKNLKFMRRKKLKWNFKEHINIVNSRYKNYNRLIFLVQYLNLVNSLSKKKSRLWVENIRLLKKMRKKKI